MVDGRAFALGLAGLVSGVALISACAEAGPAPGAEGSQIAPASTAAQPLLAYDTSRGGGVYGPSITVDLCFAYYRKHSYAEICRAIRQQGFTSVQLVDYGADCSPEPDITRFAAAARAAGLAPVLCIYPGTHSGLYRTHPEWRQRMLTGIDGKCDWRTYLCPNNPAFVSAYCDYVETRMRAGGFDGIQLAEIWFENWGGPTREGKPNPNYACVCEKCGTRFKDLTGAEPRLMLADPQSPYYYRKPENAALYARWVDMRVQTIQDYGAAIIAAARRANPKACVKVMYMADARVELNGGREYLGTDLDRMVREWRPDVMCFQDAWQDWLQKDLKPGFVSDYAKAYKDRLEKLHPGIFLTSHADIGSKPESKRSVEWIRQFAEETVRAGFGAPSFYEWHISSMAGITQ